MTRFEREAWIITGGAALKVFDLDLGGPVPLRAGITICYDVEFPLIARAMAAAGADLILCPSCTDTLAGANRSEEHTSELQSLMRISYAVFCLKKKKTKT